MSVHMVALVWRMLSSGLLPEVVAETTGVSLDDVLDLKLEMPS